MKILIYCQHVLGAGHLFRTLELARAMHDHQVTLLLGGPQTDITPDKHIQTIQLPGLKMDTEFSELLPAEKGRSIEEVKQQRLDAIFTTVRECRPDILMIELFPFGRNGFAFELVPLLEAIRSGELPGCRIVCSLRDILVEKKNLEKFEQRVIDRLNRLFDALLIHADPEVIPLDATFSRIRDIKVPIVYTGYVAEKPEPEEAQRLRRSLQLAADEKLIVVSAGGGNVGFQLLAAALEGFSKLQLKARMQLFTGPYLDPHDFDTLLERKTTGITISRFADNFPVWLGAADLSLSMGGYNTTMNVLAAGTPALIFPFSQNREQKMRAERLSTLADLAVLDEEDLAPSILAEKMSNMVQNKRKLPAIRMNGAEFTERWLSQWITE